MKACVLIPVYEHGPEVREVVRGISGYSLPCLLVDDGSSEPTRTILRELAAREPWTLCLRLPLNSGKGAALKHGLAHAANLGFTHAIQLDADGQHDPARLPDFLEELSKAPDALILGVPRFDATVPRARLCARQLSRALVWLATLSFEIRDPLCGFRAYPIGPVLELCKRTRLGNRMEFEPELAVRLYWEGVPIRSIPTPITYPPGGLSHFSFAREYPRLAGLYARLLLGMLRRSGELARRRAPEVNEARV